MSGCADIIIDLVRPEGQGPPNRRVLKYLGRFDCFPSELVIELTENGYIPLGSPDVARVDDLEKALLQVLPDGEAEAVKIDDLMADLKDGRKVSRPTLKKALGNLVRQGRVQVTGDGVKGNPEKYFAESFRNPESQKAEETPRDTPETPDSEKRTPSQGDGVLGMNQKNGSATAGNGKEADGAHGELFQPWAAPPSSNLSGERFEPDLDQEPDPVDDPSDPPEVPF